MSVGGNATRVLLATALLSITGASLVKADSLRQLTPADRGKNTIRTQVQRAVEEQAPAKTIEPKAIESQAGAASPAEGSKAVEASAPDPTEKGRFSVVKLDGEILRIDRQTGHVGICREANAIWRCAPVPVALEAYEAEITSLGAEVDRLRARLRQIESDQATGSIDRVQPTPKTEERAPQSGPDLSGPDLSVPEESDPQASSPQSAIPEQQMDPSAPGDDDASAAGGPAIQEPNVADTPDGPQKPAPRLSKKDEEEFEKFMQFSEKAMRRFFGLMKDMRDEFASGEGG